METVPWSKQFSVRLVARDTWAVNCASKSGETPNPHLLIGEQYALVIDTTDTLLPLRRYIEEYITDKPLLVASTHSHGDHTLANSQFQDRPIYMSQIAWDEILRQRAEGLDDRHREHQLGGYTPVIVKPGDVISLGGRDVEAIAFGGCHSASSVSFLDRKHGILFPGDELESGQVLIQGDFRGGHNTVENYRDQLLALKKLGDAVRIICPPHNGTPVDAQFIDFFLENCERIISGFEGSGDIGSLSYLLGPNEPRSPERVKALRWDPDSRRSEWKGTSLVYSVGKIFNPERKETAL